MLNHVLTRLVGCFATGVLATSVPLIGPAQAAPMETALKLAWLWLGGLAAVALGFVLSELAGLSPRPRSAPWTELSLKPAMPAFDQLGCKGSLERNPK